MSLKTFIKPSVFKIFIFVVIAVFYLYFAKEDVCGAGLFFAFCYQAYGFPFSYLITGDIDTASGHIKTLMLGDYFTKSGNFLFNTFALLLDLVLIYALACFLDMLFDRKTK